MDTNAGIEMMILIKISFLILFTCILYYIIYRDFLRKTPLKKNQHLAQLLIIGIMFVIYVRFIIHDLTIDAPSDENLYTALARDITNGKNPPVSGPGFLYIIILFSNLSGISFELVSAVLGVVLGSMFLVILYLIYRKRIKGIEKSVQSCIILVSSSYLIWPIIESRPQQLGMLLVFIGGILFYQYLNERKFLILFISISLFTFFYHILSFLILIGIVSIIWWFYYCANRTSVKNSFPLIGLLVFCGFLFFHPRFIYSGMAGGVEWMIETSRVSFLWNPNLFPLYLFGTLAFIFLITFVVKRYGLLNILEEFAKKRVVQITVIILIGVTLGIVIQFILNREVYLEKYRNSFVLFLIFQLGNIWFGLLFIRGYFVKIKKGDFECAFFQISSILMLMGLLVLIISIFLPVNFNNWMIRIINYWTLFSAPIILFAISELKPTWRKYSVIIIPVLVILSLMNISRDQSIFGYP